MVWWWRNSMPAKLTKPEFNFRDKLEELDYYKVPYQKMPPGSIIQVNHHFSTSQETIGTKNTAYEMFGIDVHPKFRTSSFLIDLRISHSYDGIQDVNTDSKDIYLYLYRNEQPISSNTNLNRYYNASYQNHTAWYKTDVPFSYNAPTHNGEYDVFFKSILYLDKPDSIDTGTEPIHYSFRVQSQNSFYLNRSKNSTSNGAVSSITVMEIAE